MLGLSLAFILSQDQTLRCCYLFLFLFLCKMCHGKRPSGVRCLLRLSDAQIYRYSYLCAKNLCDVDSVTFSCVTATPVRAPHLPCLSLFLVYRNHFNELNLSRKLRGSCAPFSRLRLQRYYKKPIPTKYFRNFFSRIFRKNPQNITYQPFTPPKFLCSTTYFPISLTQTKSH